MVAPEVGYGLKACGCVCSSLQLIFVLIGYMMWMQAGDLYELVPMKECFGKGEHDETFDTKIDCEFFMSASHAERIFEGYKDVDGNIKQHIFLVTNVSVAENTFLQEGKMSKEDFQVIKDNADGDGKQFYGIDEYDTSMLIAAGILTLLCGLIVQLAQVVTEAAREELKEEGGNVWRLLVDGLLWILGNCVNSSLGGFSCDPEVEGSGILSSNLSATILWNSFGILFILMITGCGFGCCLTRGMKQPALCCSGLGMVFVFVIGATMVFVMSYPIEFGSVTPKLLIGTVIGECTFGSQEGLPDAVPIMMTMSVIAGGIKAVAQVAAFAVQCVESRTDG